MKKIFLLLSLVLAFSNTSNATHFMGGEITVTHISGNDYFVVLTAFIDMNGPVSQTADVITAFDINGISTPLLMPFLSIAHPTYALQSGAQIPKWHIL